MADDVRTGQQVSQDSPRKIVAEVVDGGFCRILLTPEEHVRCTTDPDFLNKVLLKASIENGLQSDIKVEIANKADTWEVDTSEADASKVDTSKADTSSGSADQGKWSDPKIKLLLSLVAEFTPHTRDMIERKAAWELISKRLEEHGHTETYFGVSKKWANLKDRYKIIVERLKKSGDDLMSSWPYFETMERILGWRMNKMKENAKPSSSTSRVNIPLPVSNDLESTKIARKGKKRKCGEIAGRSQKRYQRRKNGTTEQTMAAPRWLTAYIEERNQEEERWLEDFTNNMSERNAAILSLAATIAEFSKA